MPRQATLFAPLVKQPPRRLMHVCDAGHNGPGPGLNAKFECAQCEEIGEWQTVKNYTSATPATTGQVRG